MRICIKCQKAKPISEFPENSKYRDGIRAFCKSCANEYLKGYYNTTAIGKLNRLRQSAHHRGLEFNISKAEFKDWFIKQEPLCHYCSQELSPPKGQHHKMTDITYDRRDNTKGYTIDNLVLACLRCNIIKGKWFTEKQMLEIAEKYLKK